MLKLSKFEQTLIKDVSNETWVNVIVTILSAEYSAPTGVDWTLWTLTVTDESNHTMDVVDFTGKTEYKKGDQMRMSVLRAEIYNNKLQLKVTSKSNVSKVGNRELTTDEKITANDKQIEKEKEVINLNTDFMSMSEDDIMAWLSLNPAANPAQYGHAENVLMHKQTIQQRALLIAYLKKLSEETKK